MKSTSTNRFLSLLRRFFGASAIVMSCFGIAQAQNIWTGTEDTNWNTTSANWTDPTVWANGAAASIPDGSGAITVTEDIAAIGLAIPGTADTLTIAADKTLSIEVGTVGTQSIPITGGWTTRMRGPGTLRLDASAAWANNNWGPNNGASSILHSGFTGTLFINRGRTDTPPAGLGGATKIKVGAGGQFLAWTGTYPQAWELAGDGCGEAGQPGSFRVAGGHQGTFTGPVTLLANTTFNSQDGNSQMIVNGVISGDFNITKSSNGGLLAFGAANTFTGTMDVQGGTLRLDNALALQNNTLTGSAGAVTFNNAAGTAFTLGGLAGTRNIALQTTTNAAITLSVGNNNADTSYGGTLSGLGGLTKIGAGTLTLTGTNTFAGPLAITAGSVIIDSAANQAFTGGLTGSGPLVKSNTGTTTINGANFGGTVTVDAGGLMLRGTASGAITVADAASFGGTVTAPQITLGSDVSLLVDPADPLTATGDLAVGGTVTVSVMGAFTAGTPFTVVEYGDKAGTWDEFDFDLAGGAGYRGFEFADTGSAITLAITGKALTWNNAAANGLWDLNTTENFTDGVGNQKFFNGDDVTFGETPGAASTVELVGTLQPATMKVDSQYDYTFGGTGSIAGGGLTKLGAGRLTLGGTNSFGGPITVSGGTLQLNSNGAVGGGGTMAVSNATLAVGPDVTTPADRAITMGAGTLLDTTLNSTGQSSVVAGIISGSDGLAIMGNGDTSDTGGGVGGSTFLSNAANDFTGDVTITSGVVRIQSGFGDPANKIVLDGGGLVDQNLNINFARNIEVGPNGGVYRTYGSVATSTLSGAITSSEPGVTLKHTDGGTYILAGDGSGFDGTFLNARGNFNITSLLWQDTDFVNMDGGTLRIRNTTGDTRIASLKSDRDVHIELNARLDIVSGSYAFGDSAGALVSNADFWMQNSGKLTSSSGMLTIDTPVSYVSLGDQSVRVIIEDYNGSTPLTVVKNGPGQINNYDKVNTYTGGTIINDGRINATVPLCFGSGTVTVTSIGGTGGTGGQAWLTSSAAPYPNNFVVEGLGSVEGAGNLGAIRFNGGNRIAGSLTVAPVGARIVAYSGAVGTVLGDLLGTGDLEINAVSANPFNGTINLNGSAATYEGDIAVSQGRLNMASGTAGGLTVRGGATFAGEGTFAGDVTLEANSTLLINPSSSEALTAGGELIATTAPVNVALNGPVPLGGAEFVVAMFDTSALDEFDLPFVLTGVREGSTFALNDNDVSVTGLVVKEINWNNAGGTNTWNTNTTANFRLADDSADTNFFAGDYVTLGDLVAGGTITVTGTVTPSGVIFDSTSNYTLTAGAIGGGGSLTKKNTGILALNAANTYTGPTVVSQGELRIGNVNAVANSTVTVNDANTGEANTAFYAAAALNGINGNVVVTDNGTGTVTLGSVSGQGGLVVYNGTFTLGKAVTFNGSSDRTTLNGKISGTPGTIRIGGAAGHRVTVGNAANDFDGDLVISTGVLYQSDSPTALPVTTSVTGEGTAQFRVNNGGTHAIDGLSGTGTTYIIAGGVATLSLGNADGDGAYSGTISNNAAVLSLAKNGTGTQELLGANTYTGTTTVNAGKLVLSNTTGSATGTGAVTVNSSATLAGTGSATGAVTIATGGTVSPGTSVGTLGTGAATLAGTYLCEIDGATADRVNVNGDLNVAGATIAFAVLNAPTEDEYVIATYTGALSGELAGTPGLPAGYQLDTESTPGQIKLVKGAGETYQTWAATKGLDETNNGRDMDPDGDGVANILEYYLDGNPLANDGSILPQPVVTDDYLVFTFDRLDSAAAEATTQEFQYGSTLAGWTNRAITATTYPDGVIIEVVDGDGTDAITVKIPRSLEGAGRLFGRLHIEVPE